MGGHEFPKIPDYKTYKVENCPELLAIQEALAKKGLRDPWLRNEVWRYDVKSFGTMRQRLHGIVFRGFTYGFGAFVATVIVTAAYEKMFPSQHDHHSHH